MSIRNAAHRRLSSPMCRPAAWALANVPTAGGLDVQQRFEVTVERGVKPGPTDIELETSFSRTPPAKGVSRGCS